jgi:uncharacterized CHY-type Zn-finger protein
MVEDFSEDLFDRYYECYECNQSFHSMEVFLVAQEEGYFPVCRSCLNRPLGKLPLSEVEVVDWCKEGF